jgi:hypothetical protein
MVIKIITKIDAKFCSHVVQPRSLHVHISDLIKLVATNNRPLPSHQLGPC